MIDDEAAGGGGCLPHTKHHHDCMRATLDVGRTTEIRTPLWAALGAGLGGGSALLLTLIIVGMLWFRKRRRSHTAQDNLENNDYLQDARRDYDTVDTNLREVELNDLKYEALQVTDVRPMDQTTDYSTISSNENDNMAYENVIG